MKRIRGLIVVVVMLFIGCPFLYAQDPAAKRAIESLKQLMDSLEVSLSARKTRIILGEPLLLRITYKNISAEEKEISVFSRWVYLVITPDGKERKVGATPKGASRTGVQWFPWILAPGQSLTIRTPVIHAPGDKETPLLFSVPGKYRLKVGRRLYGFAVEPLFFPATLEFEVEEPQLEVDKQAYQLIEADRQAWLKAGSHTSSYARAICEGGDPSIFNEIVQKFPQSTYAPYCKFFAARARTYWPNDRANYAAIEPFFVSTTPEALAHFQEIVKNQPDHEFAGEAAFILFQFEVETAFLEFPGSDTLWNAFSSGGAEAARAEIEKVRTRKNSLLQWLRNYALDHPESGLKDVLFMFEDIKRYTVKKLDDLIESAEADVRRWEEQAK